MSKKGFIYTALIILILEMFIALCSANPIIVDDNQPPELIVNPSKGDIKSDDEIIIRAADPSGVYTIRYRWNSDKESNNRKNTEVIVPVPHRMYGPNRLYVSAEDELHNNTGWKVFEYNVINPNISDNIPPTIEVNPPGGNIEPNGTIDVIANDLSDINHIGYAWNGGDAVHVYSSSTRITVPKELLGPNTLRLYVRDNSPNVNDSGWKSYDYTITDNRFKNIFTFPNIISILALTIASISLFYQRKSIIPNRTNNDKDITE